MLRSKEIMTAVAALTCAIGIGFIMQNSESAQALYGDERTRVPQEGQRQLKDANAAGAVLEVQEITLTSAEFENEIMLPATDGEVAALSAPPEELAPPTVPTADMSPACEMVATARPTAGAMVELGFIAPCLPNERVTVHHNGMLFTETTSENGTLRLKVPALSAEAVFILAFANGEGAVAQTTVEDIGDYDRSVLQWKGNTGFQIHAREFGADYGAPGHVWAEAPGDIVAAIVGDGGVLTRHGDTSASDPLLAEVYTFPRATNGQAGSIAISVEAEVTQANCGQEIEAQSLELLADGLIRTQNLILPVPDCDSTGSFLVLNNLLQDLKVAGN